MDAVKGLDELEDDTSTDGEGRAVALGLHHIDARYDVGVEKGRDDVHLLDLEVLATNQGEEVTKGCAPNCRGDDRDVVQFLYVTLWHAWGDIGDTILGAIGDEGV